jgi:hypothetical protein
MRSTSATTRLLALAAALFALALVGIGCGEDDGGSTGGGGEDEITALVEESVSFEDPATICEENFTEELLEENYEGDDREALLKDCSDDDAGGIEEVEVTDVKVKGETATAEVTAHTEESDEPAKFSVDLVEEEGWKIDGVN